jgi:hypothetical protein
MQTAPSQGAISGSAQPSTLKADSESRTDTTKSQSADASELPINAVRVGSGMLISSCMEPKPIEPVSVHSTNGAALSVPHYSMSYGYRI